MQTAAQQQAALEQRQDELRPVRQFLSLVSGFQSDQTYGMEDSIAVNQPGQFAVYGPYGAAMEGQPVMSMNQPAGGISPMVLLAGVAVVAFLLLK